jgi:NAD+ synthase (glutamine-hydrolysing)
MGNNFFNPWSQGFFRCGAATVKVRPADPDFNLEAHLELAHKASDLGVGLTVFPELGLSGYSVQDLVQQKVLLDRCKLNLSRFIEESQNLFGLFFVGLPLIIEDRLYNCAAAIHQGVLLGIIPKTILPNHREFYEKRHFASAQSMTCREITLFGDSIMAGTDILFECDSADGVRIGAEICEDLWAPVSPATLSCMAGATIIGNLSASNTVIGKADYRRLLIKSFSGRNICSYVYSSAGEGESTTDLAWDGHAIIAENAVILKENQRFKSANTLCVADVDVEKLLLERIRTSTFKESAGLCADKHKSFRIKNFSFDCFPEASELLRDIDCLPFVPKNDEQKSKRCEESLEIQTQGLCTRLRQSNINKVIVGVSGGLDSTLALLVANRALRKLGLPQNNLIGVTMPGFATSEQTKNTAHKLMKALGAEAKEIDIIPSCMQMLQDLEHPFAQGERVYDVTFENVQAGERTSHLFRLANSLGALVAGTGDLSELALGWCTYGVGDHMSHYNLNASVPKTLIQHLISWFKSTEDCSDQLKEALEEVLATEISPELIPDNAGNKKLQSTQKTIGPYELHDFFLYYLTRYGFKPSKVAYLCYEAWRQKNSKDAYSLSCIKKWLKVFVTRFFGQSQFKRSCAPDSVKVGSGGSLSPRGDWRAPSDASARLWLEELEAGIPDID